MAPNLISLVMQFLTPDMVGRIAAALGLDRNATQSAIGAAVPSLLAGLSNVATQPGGAQKLASFAMQHAGALQDVAGQIGSREQSSLVDQGSQILSSLLGSRDQNSLASAIGNFAGLGQGAIGSLLGMLTPVIFATIARQQGAARAIDPSSIANLLAGQKDNIIAALPPGLGNLLSTGLLDSIGTAAARTAAAAGGEVSAGSAAAARAFSNASQRATATGESGGNNWLYWLIPAAAIAAALFYFAPRQLEGPQLAQSDTTVGQGTTVSALELNKNLSDSIGDLRNVLSGVTDAASAKAALPKLRAIADQFDSVDNLRGRLSPEQRKALIALAGPMMPPLNQLFDKVLAVPGVADELRPTIDALKGKLAVLSA